MAKASKETAEKVRETLTGPTEVWVNPDLKSLSKEARAALERATKRNVRGQWWQPTQDGDFILGHLTGMREQDSQFTEKGKKKKQTVLTLDRGDEGVMQVSCNVVLQNEVERAKPQNGDYLLICYRGKASSARRGKPASLYTLEVIERAQ